MRYMIAIVKKLEHYRLKHKITQEQLARMLGVSFCTVNRWENMKTKPNKIQTFHIQELLRRK